MAKSGLEPLSPPQKGTGICQPVATTEALLDQRAEKGPPFNKTSFPACFYLEHQRICFIQTVPLRPAATRCLAVLKEEGRPESPPEGECLQEGECSSEPFGHGTDCSFAVSLQHEWPSVAGPRGGTGQTLALSAQALGLRGF